MTETEAQSQKVVFTSYAAEDFVQGGLIDDVDVAIKDIVFTLDAPPEYHSPDPVFGVRAWLSMLENPDEVVEQWWSCGTRKAHHPCTPEGELVNEGPYLTGGQLMRNSNFHEFEKSMQHEGFPKALADTGDLRHMIGVEIHVQRKTIKREGLAGAPRDDGRAPQTLICTKLIHMPGEKRVAKSKPAASAVAARPAAAASAARPRTAATATAAAPTAPPATAAPVAPPATPAEFNASVVAVEILSNMLEANPAGISLAAAKLAANTELVHTYQTSLLNRNKVVALLFAPAWLEEQGVRIEGEALVLAV
jgi:hypothetical protein